MPTIFFLTILAICKQPSFIFRHTVSRRAVPVGELQRLNLSERRLVEGAPQFPARFGRYAKIKPRLKLELRIQTKSWICIERMISTSTLLQKKIYQLLIPQDLPLLHHYHHELFLFYIATTDTSPNCGTITAVGWNRNYHVLYPSLDFCLSCKHSPAQTYVFLCVSQRHNNLHKVIHTDV